MSAIVRFHFMSLLTGTIILGLGIALLGARLLVAPVPIERTASYALLAGLYGLVGLSLAARLILEGRAAPGFLQSRSVGGRQILLGRWLTFCAQLALVSPALFVFSYAILPRERLFLVGTIAAGLVGTAALAIAHRVESSWIATTLALAVAGLGVWVLVQDLPRGLSYSFGWATDSQYWTNAKVFSAAVCCSSVGIWLTERRA